MNRQWKIVSLAIFLMIGAVITSVFTGDVGQWILRQKNDFGDGAVEYNIAAAYVDSDGDPVKFESFTSRSFLDTGGQQVTDFKAQFRQITVKGAGYDPQNLRAKMWVTYPYMKQENVLDTKEISAGAFEIDGNEFGFTANAFSPWVKTVGLQATGDQLRIDYKRADFRWGYVVKVKVWIDGVAGVSDTFQKELAIITDWQDPASSTYQPPPHAPPGFTDPYLEVDATVTSGDWGSVGGKSFIPGTSRGLSVFFIIEIAMVGLWYKTIYKRRT